MTTVTKLIDEADIHARVKELAEEIARDLPKDVLVVGLLKGAFVFTADLYRELDKAGMEPQIEFLRLSSYGNSKESSGEVLVSGNIPSDVEGKHLLVLDDILDTGRSLAFAKNMFLERGAAQVTTCVLLDKPSRREVDSQADYVGFKIEDLFVVGYGIDYAQKFRHLPYVGTVD